ncbi:hypothetical protein BKP35_13370 [Anaerobacillus arseniciselenatis]|uniref:Uncharacterized protein n=1 Tax=Anaerobacillus arseniciselenatis TaxID=85682 RepID=A0A1S2LCI0_9BACI|nr:hypothetical protein [Anaerobacillus arseniciselenatis]OIJ10101.1 hypothetical protein BKP35_13370 [Anaerobacillus arseniciselenatis]
MGYVPPVRDQQSFQYGNRSIHSHRSIKQISPVSKGKFHRVLSEQEKEAFNDSYKYYKANDEKQNKKQKRSQVLSELTGKGTYIDEVV